jgi:hypothetical protein
VYQWERKLGPVLLHSTTVETNFSLWHPFRLRQQIPDAMLRYKVDV